MNKTKIITVGNFKGGSGKTTNSVMIANSLAEKGHKVCLFDVDSQADATRSVMNTGIKVYNKKYDFQTSLMDSFISGDLQTSLYHINENLDVLASYIDLEEYEEFVISKYSDKEKRIYFFKELLNKFVEETKYDYIIIDTPPRLTILGSSAIVSSDYVLIVLQTQERALVGAERYLDHIATLSDLYDTNVDVVGFLPVLLNQNSTIDEMVLENAYELFGKETFFTNVVRHMERLKRYDSTGITFNKKDIHDIRAHKKFDDISSELLKRIEIIEEN